MTEMQNKTETKTKQTREKQIVCRLSQYAQLQFYYEIPSVNVNMNNVWMR